MSSAWRLTKTRHAATAWDGQAASRSGGRWNSPGVRVVYTSSALSLALVEILVHLPSGLLPAFSAMRVDFDDTLVSDLPARDLPANFQADPPPRETRAIGDAWVRSLGSAVLSVPSAVVPSERNYLLNPAHPDFVRLKFGKPQSFPFDARLAKR